MKKKKKYILIPLIVVIMLLTIYLSSELISYLRLGITKICVASISLPQRTKISEEYLKEISIPKAFILDNAYLTKEEIINKYVRLDAFVPKGSLFYKDFLEDENNMKDGIHYKLNEDEVTYDLFIKDVKVNPAYLTKDMNVDLYLTINRKSVSSDLLLSGARIIGLYDLNNKEIKYNNDNASLGIISLAVKREFIPVLNKAIVVGDVNLVVSSNLYEEGEMYLNSSSDIFNQLS